MPRPFHLAGALLLLAYLNDIIQGETHFAGRERAPGWELGKSKKKGAGSGWAPRALVLIGVFCQDTRDHPLCSPVFRLCETGLGFCGLFHGLIPSFFALTPHAAEPRR